MGLKMKIGLPKGYPYLYETHLHTSQGNALTVDTDKRMAVDSKVAGSTWIFDTDIAENRLRGGYVKEDGGGL